MIRLYLEVKFLLKEMRRVRKLDESEIADWSRQVGPAWGYLYQKHY